MILNKNCNIKVFFIVLRYFSPLDVEEFMQTNTQVPYMDFEPSFKFITLIYLVSFYNFDLFSFICFINKLLMRKYQWRSPCLSVVKFISGMHCILNTIYI